MKPLAFADVAVLVRAGDDAAVAKRSLGEGARITLDGALPGGSPGAELRLRAAVSPGHRFVLRDVPAGELVRQYGEPIGTSRGLVAGDVLTPENLANEVPIVREVPEDLTNPPPEYVPEPERPTFRGIRRPDGRVGTRNWIAIVPTSMCASHEATQIALRAELSLHSRERFPAVDGVVALPHDKGCGCPDGSNLEVLLRTLAAYADHPNVGGVVFIDLGCEKTHLGMLGRYLKDRGGLSWEKPTAWIGIQEVGGTEAAIAAGLAAVEEMLPAVQTVERTDVSVSELVLGVKCGGSDGFSGLTANPALGACADRLVRNGGTVILTEVPEFCGAEHVLARRAKDAETARAIYAMVDWYKRYAATVGARLDENPSPGNVAGGLLNITLKSLGAIAKGGTTRVESVTDYATRPTTRGLVLMQGPGYDQMSTPGLVAAGCQLVVFTTGRGSTIGNAIAPVLKLATNTPVFERMSRDLDLDAGTILTGRETVDEVGERVFRRCLEVASGERVRAEETGHREFQVWGERAVAL